MNPDNNSLESSYDSSAYSSSLEGKQGAPVASPVPDVKYKSRRLNIPLFKFNKVAILVTVAALLMIAIVGGGALLYDKLHNNHKTNTYNSEEANGTYKVGSSISVQQANASTLLQIGQANQIQINGQLIVNKALVLTPSSVPSSPTSGEIYYDKSTNQPYFYNGSSFVSLGQPAVTSLGGSSGAIGLGTGLTINGGNLAVSTSLLQSLSNAPSGPVVNSFQGATGNVSLSSGSGISINGTTISNSGVLNINGGTGIDVTNQGNGTYTVGLIGNSTVVTDIAGEDGSISLGSGLNISGNELSNIGVVNVSGTTDQVIASASTGSIVLSLPQSINTTSDVQFNDETLGDNLTVDQSATIDNGLSVTGTTSLQATTDSSTLNVEGTLTVGNPGQSGGTGQLLLASSANSNSLGISTQSQSNPNTTVQFPTLVGETSDTVCLEFLANCGGSPSTVTASSTGSNGYIAVFTGADTIAPSSSVQDNGGLFTVGEALQDDYNIYTNKLENNAGNLSVGSTGTLGVSADSGSGQLSLSGNSTSTFSGSDNSYEINLGFPSTSYTGTANITLPDVSGTVCLTALTGDNCGYATSGSGVTSVDGLNGALTINDTCSVTCTGTTITLNNASTSQAGVVQLANTGDLYINGSGYLDTIQGIQTSADVQFGSLSAGSTKCFGGSCTSGTVYANNVDIGSTGNSIGTGNLSGFSNTLQFTSNGITYYLPDQGASTQEICTPGVNCASGGGAGVIIGDPSGIQTYSGGGSAGIGIDQTAGSTDLIELQTGGNDDFAINSSGNTTISNDLNVTGILDNPSSTLTLGSVGGGSNPPAEPYLLQGTESSEILGSNGSNSTYLGYYPYSGPATSGSVYYAFDTGAPANTSSTPYIVCTTSNNCSGLGGELTGTGTTNDIAYFSSPSGVSSSIITQNSTSLISVGGNLDVGSGSNEQLTIGSASSGTNSSIILNNGTNGDYVTLSEDTSSLTGVANITFPDSGGEVCIVGSSSCDFAASGSGVTSLNGNTGAICINDTNTGACSGTTLTIQNGSTLQPGLVQLANTGNLIINGSGYLDTVQNITTSSSPTFSTLALQGANALTLGTSAVGGNVGQITFYDGTNDGLSQSFKQLGLSGSTNGIVDIPNLAGGTATLDVGTASSCVSSANILSQSSNGAVQLTCSPTFSSVTTPLLNGSSGLTINPQGTLTVNTSTTTNAFNIYGSSGSSGSFLEGISGSNSTKVDFDSPTSVNTINFPTSISGDICVQTTGFSSNCSFAAAGNYINNTATSGLAQTSAQIDIQGASSQNILDLYKSTSSTSGTPDLYVDSNANLKTVGTINGASITSTSFDGATLSGGTLSGSTLSSTGLTFSGSTDTITGPSASSITLDTTGSATLNLGNANATTINLGNSSSTTSIQGGSGITLTTNNASTGVIDKSSTNNTTAFQVQNASSLNTLSVDTTNNAVDLGYMLPPTSFAVVVTGSGGSLPASTVYYFKIVAVDSSGTPGNASAEYNGSSTSGACPSSGTCEESLSWTAVSGAASYRIYYGTSSGGEANYFTSSTNSYTMTTTTGNTAGLPASKTTGPAGYVQQLTTSLTGTNYLLNTTIQTANNSTTGFQIQNNAGTALLSADTTNMRIDIGTEGTANQQLYVSGSSPTSSTSSVTTGTTPTSVYVQGSYAYVVNNGSNTLTIYSISTTTGTLSSSSVGSVSTGGSSSPWAVFVRGSYAYVVNHSSGTLAIFNVSNPANPISAGTPVSTGSGSDPRNVYVQGNYAYVVNSGTNTLAIFNVSNPTNPTLVGSIATGVTGSRGLYVQGSYAYVTGITSSTLAVFNVSNPATPTSTGTPVATGIYPYSVYVQGNYAYIADEFSGSLGVFNVSNPNSPVSAGTSISTGANSYSVYVQGNYAYVANEGANTLSIVNVSNPASLSIAGTVSTGTGPESVYVQGNYAYVANNGSNTLTDYDVGGAYIQQLQTGGLETGTLQVDSNASISGDENVTGGLTIGGETELNGNAGIQGSLTLNGALQGGNNLSEPAAPTVTPQSGGTANTNYSYAVAAVSSTGGITPASVSTQTTTGSSSLSSFYNTISWTAVPNAASYNIYRTASSGTPSSTGYIGNTTGTTFNDTGIAATGSVPTTDTSGSITVNGTTSINGAFQIQNSSGVNLLQVGTSGGNNINIGAVGSAAYTANVNIDTTTNTNQAETVTIGNSASNTNVVLSGSISTTGTLSLLGENVYNTNSGSGSATANGDSITLSGHSTSGGINTQNGINFNSVTAISNNIFNGLSFASSDNYNYLINSSELKVLGSSSNTANISTTPEFQLQPSTSATDPNILSIYASGVPANNTNYVASFSTASTSSSLDLGSTGNYTGNLVLASSTATSGTVTLSNIMGASTTSYTLTLPTGPAVLVSGSYGGQCLETTSGSTSTVDNLTIGACTGAAHAKVIQVTAEYEGAVLDSASDSNCSSANIGTMVSGYTGDNTNNTYNAVPLASPSTAAPQNFYDWSTTQSTSQCYDIVAQVKVPSDYASNATSGENGYIAVYTPSGGTSSVYMTEATSTASSLTYSQVSSNSSGTQCVTPNATGTGGTNISGDTSSGYFCYVAIPTTTPGLSAGGTLTIKIRVSSTSAASSTVGTGSHALVGDIIIPYTTGY